MDQSARFTTGTFVTRGGDCAGTDDRVGGWRLNGDRASTEWCRDAVVLDLDDPSTGWRSIDSPVWRRALAAATADGHLVTIGGLTEDNDFSARVDLYNPETDAWTRGPDFPDDPFGVSAVGVDDAVYASGKSGIIYRYRPGGDGWARVAELTFPRFFHELVATGSGDLLAVGGILDGRRVAHIERIALNASHSDGIHLTSWTLPAPGDACNRQGIALHDHTLYLFGGNNSPAQHDFAPDNFLSEAFALDLRAMRFHPLEELPFARQSMETVTIDDSDGPAIFALGGFAHDGTRTRAYSDVLTYDINADTWRDAGRLLSPRSQFGAVIHGDELFLFGGHEFDRTRFDEGFHHKLDVESCRLDSSPYTFEATGWKLPRTRRVFGGARVGSKYYLVGGIGEGSNPCRRVMCSTSKANPGPRFPRRARPESHPASAR